MYILKSLKDNKLYIGSTSDLRKRFKEHNLGLAISTKFRRPFKLVYYEAYLSEQDARQTQGTQSKITS
jgi:putative endonuclease